MKKIYYIVSLAVLALLSACQDYNATNFPGFDQAAIPTNLIMYNYTLVDADYSTISKEALKVAKTKKDSTIAKAIATNKFLLDTVPAKTYVPYFLATKFLYNDAKSTVMVTYNKSIPYDTTKIATTNKYTLLDDDYISMGTATNLPGQYKNFSSAIDPNFYIPIWLKSTNKLGITPYIKSGEIRLIRYKFYTGTATVTNYLVFIYDGTNWIKYNPIIPQNAKFVFKDGTWQFIDSDIYMGLIDGLGDFKIVSVTGDQVWAWDVNYKYMLMTGYVSATKEYFSNEDWLISPPLNLTERVTPWVSFMHVGRYFGDTGTSTDKMHKAITLWGSTTSDGTSIKPEDWKQLTIPDAGYPSGASWTFITSTPISLAAYAGKNNVRIAFKYMSDAADKAAGSWEIKTFYVFEQ